MDYVMIISRVYQLEAILTTKNPQKPHKMSILDFNTLKM